MKHNLYNIDCIKGAKKYIKDDRVDLIITDPPYGIKGNSLHKHYNRNEKNVIDGYIEIPIEEYEKFSIKWIKEAERILRPGGSIYIVSGYTNLNHILNALEKTNLKQKNHIIWKYNFGVHTKNKYVSSHYHILYYVKPGNKPVFNTYCRFGPDEKDEDNKSLNYQDREDVWIINREYKPGKTKNKNELPTELLAKMIQYSSNHGDLICDMFLGGFSTAVVSIGLNRNIFGFEKSKNIYEHGIKRIKKIKPGNLLENIRNPNINLPENQGKKWTSDDFQDLYGRYIELYNKYKSKEKTINLLCKEFGRGKFSIINALNKIEKNDKRTNTKLEEFT